MLVVVSYTTGQYLDIALTTVQYEYIALAVALIYVIGRIQVELYQCNNNSTINIK